MLFTTGRPMRNACAWVASLLFAACAHAALPIAYKSTTVDGIRIFYREAGDPGKPTLLLLHGFPASSHMFRELIPQLSGSFHLIAPDYPGAGYSEAPPADRFTPSFDKLAELMEKFVLQQSVNPHLIVYMQDFGGPVGMRLAVKHPGWIDGLIVQNSPVSLSGWNQAYLKGVQGGLTAEKRAATLSRVTPATAQYFFQQGARQPEALNPDAWTVHAAALSNPEGKRIMAELLLDIPANLAQYAAWQAWLREHQPKTLVAWGSRDPIFAPAGATDLRQLVPAADIHLYDTGHFALEEDGADIAAQILRFFGK